MTEAQLKDAVTKAAHEHGWLVFSLPMSKIRRLVKDASGYPDLTLARDGAVLWLELKQEKGIVSNAQRKWMDELPSVYVVREPDLFDGTLARLLG